MFLGMQPNLLMTATGTSNLEVICWSPNKFAYILLETAFYVHLSADK